jgi:hypothetical protein
MYNFSLFWIISHFFPLNNVILRVKHTSQALPTNFAILLRVKHSLSFRLHHYHGFCRFAFRRMLKKSTSKDVKVKRRLQICLFFFILKVFWLRLVFIPIVDLTIRRWIVDHHASIVVYWVYCDLLEPLPFWTSARIESFFSEPIIS